MNETGKGIYQMDIQNREELGDDILVESEFDVDVEVDAFIKLEGSLELELE